MLGKNQEVVERAYDDIEKNEQAKQLVVRATQLDMNWLTLGFACPNTALIPQLYHWQQVRFPAHLFEILELI